jgi:hypothetical protein
VSRALILASGLLALVMCANAAPVRGQAVIYSDDNGAGKRAGQVFLTLGGIVGVRRLPDWTSPYVIAGIAGSQFVAGQFRPELFLYGPGATFGYVFNKGVMPDWMGANPRASLTGAAWWGQWSKSSILNPTGFTLPSEALLPQFFHRLHIDHREGELVLRVKSDWRLSPAVTLSPSIAAFGGASRTRYQYNAHLFDAVGRATRPYWLHQLVKGYSVGGFASLRTTWRISDRVTFSADTHVGAYFAWMTLQARDCFLNATASLCQGAAAVTNSLNATDSAIGVRTGLTTVLSVRLGRSFIEFGGFMMFQTAVPTVRNQQVGMLPLGAVPTVAGFRSAWTAGGFIQWRIPFGYSR